jgi:hypothetical protein
MVPIAAFLAGALLSILLPVALLIALAAWYWVFSLRVPETPAEPGSVSEPSAAHQGPPIPQSLPPDPVA